jgi:hypothetical protein
MVKEIMPLFKSFLAISIGTEQLLNNPFAFRIFELKD